MKRRLFLKQLVYTSGVLFLVPSCIEEKKKESALYKNIKVDKGQEQCLAELSETIIPATDSPGAKDISAHLFVLMMIDDCYKKKEQGQFLRGLNDFENTSREKFGKAFASCSQKEKESFLQELDSNKFSAPDLSFFYSNAKKLTIRAFTSSKHYLTKVHVYELVPSRYHGCVPVKSTIKPTP